jgi:hypothetical protein
MVKTRNEPFAPYDFIERAPTPRVLWLKGGGSISLGLYHKKTTPREWHGFLKADT